MQLDRRALCSSVQSEYGTLTADTSGTRAPALAWLWPRNSRAWTLIPPITSGKRPCNKPHLHTKPLARPTARQGSDQGSDQVNSSSLACSNSDLGGGSASSPTASSSMSYRSTALRGTPIFSIFLKPYPK